MFDEIHEECGVFGAYRVDNAASITYYGLHSLQHRGQEASGIAVSDGENITLQKGKGLTVDVFQKEKLDSMVGRLAVGHVRYSTAGGQENENIQPRLGEIGWFWLSLQYHALNTSKYEIPYRHTNFQPHPRKRICLYRQDCPHPSVVSRGSIYFSAVRAFRQKFDDQYP